MENVDEEFYISADISQDDDRSVLTVYRCIGSEIKLHSVFTGDEAKWMYERLIQKKGIGDS